MIVVTRFQIETVKNFTMIYFQLFLIVSIFPVVSPSTSYPTTITGSVGTTWRTQRAVPTITTYPTSHTVVSSIGSTDTFASKDMDYIHRITVRISEEAKPNHVFPTLATFPNNQGGVTDTFDSEDLSADNPSTTTDTFTGKDLTPKTPSTPTRQAVTDVSSMSPESGKEETIGASEKITGRASSLVSRLNVIAISVSFVNLMTSRKF